MGEIDSKQLMLVGITYENDGGFNVMEVTDDVDMSVTHVRVPSEEKKVFILRGMVSFEEGKVSFKKMRVDNVLERVIETKDASRLEFFIEMPKFIISTDGGIFIKQEADVVQNDVEEDFDNNWVKNNYELTDEEIEEDLNNICKQDDFKKFFNLE